MNIAIFDSSDGLAAHAADVVAEFVRVHRAPVLGLATGGTMTPVYAELIDRYRRGQISFSQTTGYLLDEYVGLPPSHPETYRNVIRRIFADHVDLESGAVRGPDGNSGDLDAECARYDRQVVGAEVGLQLLGLGRNGHIAFNEPGESLESSTRVVALSEATRADNSRFFGLSDAVPTHAVTQGIKTVSAASRLLVIAQGANKAEAVHGALEGPVTASLPASALQLHDDVTVLLDREAAGLLSATWRGRSGSSSRTSAARVSTGL